MFAYLWNLCKFVLLKITAFLWNVVIKLAQGKQQPQVNNTAKGKVVVSMANEVWTDVFGFLKRVELARTVSLSNRHIHQICWPRLHGNKVMAHKVGNMLITSQDADDGWSKTAIALIDLKAVPFANCPPPDYITDFPLIQILFLNEQVLAFIKVIAPHLTIPGIGVQLSFLMQMENMDEQQRGFINQMIKILREDKSPNTAHSMYTRLDNIQFLPPDMDNKTHQIELSVDADTDIPLLMKWLATPRTDGQQRVIWLTFYEDGNDQLAMEMVDAIKQDFRTSTKPLPQPFYIVCQYRRNNPRPHNLNIPSEEENAQTDETLTISAPFAEDYYDHWWRIKIYRHPSGEHGKWAEDARKRAVEDGQLVNDIRILQIL